MSNKIESLQVLGSGCPNCKQLFEATKKVAEELKIDVVVEYINDIGKMVEMGVMTSPVLAINGAPVLTGGGKTEDDIRQALIKKCQTESGSPSACSCGCRC
jgi:small redox-active disulfide protein 2